MCTFFSSLFFLFLLSLQVFLHKTVVAAVDETTTETTAHFADTRRGRMSWVIDESSLPWTGQYFFIESTQSPMSELLVVVDSSNGNHLGNCASFAPRDNKWRRFFWTLTEDSLICNVTDIESAISKVHFPPSNFPRTFSLRILAQQGPKCFRDMIVQNEKLEACPPELKRNSFQQMSLECGCPVHTQENSDPQQSFKLEVRTSVAPFHFINSRISSSIDGNSAVSHDKFPGLLQNTKSPLFVTTTTTTESTTLTNTTTEAPIATNGIVPSPLPNSPVEATGSGSVPSMLQLPALATATTTESPVAAHVPALNAHPCAGMHCQNNGTCVLGPDGGATCMCPEGFMGAQCEIDLCSSVHCMHGGLCQTTNNVPYCECQSGTTGTFCEEVICNPRCEQGGICAIINGVPVCHCPTGTVGINCNIIDTCNNNADACTEFGNDARCQLDPNTFALISPVAVNATFKCLCLNDQSEWIDCKLLPVKPQLSMTVATVTTTAPNIQFPFAPTPALAPETPEQPLSSQHIIRLLQNNPHLSHLLPNSLLIPNTTTAVTTTTAPFVDANAGISRSPAAPSVDEVPSAASLRPIELFPGLQTATLVPAPTKTSAARIPFLFSATLPPFFITPKSFHFHLFNTTSKADKMPELETTATITTITELLGPLDSANLTTLMIETSTTNSTEIEMEARVDGINMTGPAPLVPLETSTGTLEPEMTTAGVNDTRTTHPSTLLEPESSTPNISASMTITGNKELSGISTSTMFNQFTSNSLVTDESTLVPLLESTSGDLTDPLMTTMSSSASKDEKDKSWTEHTAVESNEELEETTTQDYTTEILSTVGEDEIKFVKLTIGLPTTTMIPDLVHRSDEATGTGSDTTRRGSSSLAIVLAVIFALLVLAGVCAMLVLRYIRRSRKLHGKYNPAREESVLSSSYSMPMTTVTKEERLI